LKLRAGFVPFTAADPAVPAPIVSCVPAEDAGGKKAFAHFVVDAQ
jgi:hypothetical protein